LENNNITSPNLSPGYQENNAGDCYVKVAADHGTDSCRSLYNSWGIDYTNRDCCLLNQSTGEWRHPGFKTNVLGVIAYWDFKPSPPNGWWNFGAEGTLCDIPADGQIDQMNKAPARVDLLRDALVTTIRSLFDPVTGISNLQVGLLSFNDSYNWVKTMSNDSASLIAAATSAYTVANVGGGTNIAVGIYQAMMPLGSLANNFDSKIIVLLSDGDTITSNDTTAADTAKNPTNKILIYTVALNANPTPIAAMSTLSSGSGFNFSTLTDITGMYAKIIADIKNKIVSLVSIAIDSVSYVNGQTLNGSQDFILDISGSIFCSNPLPPTPHRLTLDFTNVSQITLSNASLTYCPILPPPGSPIPIASAGTANGHVAGAYDQKSPAIKINFGQALIDVFSQLVFGSFTFLTTIFN